MSIAQSNIAQQILNVAIRQFADKGYEATSTREIVEAAGVTKPMLYYYFQSKDGLCRAALQHYLEPFVERMGEAVANADVREALVDVIWLHFEFCQQSKDLSRFFLLLYFGPERHRFADLFQEHNQREGALLNDVARRAVEQNMLAAGSEEDFIMALHGTVAVWNMRVLEEDIILDRPRAARLVDRLLHGYCR